MNEEIVVLLPAAVYSLCTGCAPFAHRFRGLPLSNTSADNVEASDGFAKVTVDVGCFLITIGSETFCMHLDSFWDIDICSFQLDR